MSTHYPFVDVFDMTHEPKLVRYCSMQPYMKFFPSPQRDNKTIIIALAK